MPAHASALAYYDTIRRERLPQNLTASTTRLLRRSHLRARRSTWHVPHRVDASMSTDPLRALSRQRLARREQAQRRPRHAQCARDPFTLIIFGASGDLAHRKLLPALFHLEQEGYLPEHFW